LTGPSDREGLHPKKSKVQAKTGQTKKKKEKRKEKKKRKKKRRKKRKQEKESSNGKPISTE
jgi:hypothetical protein